MPRRSLVITLILLACANPLHAAGINLSWDDCGANGISNKAYACQGETGVHTLVASVVPPPGLVRFNGVEAVIDIQFEGTTMPSWWELENGCRASRMAISFDFTSGPFSCEDFWRGRALGAMLLYERNPSGNRALIKVIGAVPSTSEGALTPGIEHYLFKFAITNIGTAGCEGCRTPACIQLSYVKLTQPASERNDKVLTERAHLNNATWQGGITNPDAELPGCRADAVQNRSWGQVKSLYR